ncbi:MAG: CoA transferase [Micromonosporaceae bacterium]|nr:CoA transferase [Micromonosporaceae bacterium]
MRPLTGIRVLDLTRYLPGGYATFLLRSLGAEVIKVEPPGGDPMRQVPPLDRTGTSRLFALVCAGKKSVTADLRDPGQLRRIVGLAASADAVVESYRPGVADRLGVGYPALRAVRPSLVYCSLRGFAPGTAREQAAGHDLNYLSLAGWVAAADGPAIARLAPGDLLGGLFAAFGVVAALGESPRGRHVETSVYGAALSWLIVHAAAGDGSIPSEGAGYRTVATKDGPVSLGALETPLWNRLCGALDIPGARYESSDTFVPEEHFRSTRAAVDSAFGGLSRARVEQLMRDVGGVAPVLTPAEALHDEDAVLSGVLRVVGDLTLLAPPLPVELDDGHVAAMGEHNDLLDPA